MTSEKIWKNFPCCECIKSFLIKSAFDNIASLMCINDEVITKLEEHIDKNRWMIDGLTCRHVELYRSSLATSSKFEFLLGHRAPLLYWCQNDLKSVERELERGTFTLEDEAFTSILREMVTSALSNHKKPPNTHRFSQLLMDFAIYVYIMAGRACYEVISENLPLPKAGTVGKIFSQLYSRFNLICS